MDFAQLCLSQWVDHVFCAVTVSSVPAIRLLIAQHPPCTRRKAKAPHLCTADPSPPTPPLCFDSRRGVSRFRASDFGPTLYGAFFNLSYSLLSPGRPGPPPDPEDLPQLPGYQDPPGEEPCEATKETVNEECEVLALCE